MTKKLFCFTVMMGCSFASFANILWVDAASGVDASGYGSEDKPYKTIQYAVNKAATTGTEIRVKPGVYDSGATSNNGIGNRVIIDSKTLKIVSTDGKEVTHIVGGGAGSVCRCVLFRNAPNSVVEGFTIRDGYVKTTDNGDSITSSAGGVLGLTVTTVDGKSTSDYSAPGKGCLVDCVVKDCQGARVGGVRGITAVRCHLTDNVGHGKDAAAASYSHLVNCLVSHNRNTTFNNFYKGTAINCTIVDNYGTVNSAKLYNSVILNNWKHLNGRMNVLGADSALDHCITQYGDDTKKEFTHVDSIIADVPYQFIAPLFDDYRVRKNSEAETAGSGEVIAKALETHSISLPEGIDAYRDLNGNPISGSGAVAAGCLQEVVSPQGGAIMFRYTGKVDKPTPIRTRGKKQYGDRLYAFAEFWPTQFMVQAANQGKPLIHAFQINGKYVYPSMDDTLYLTPPESPMQVYTNNIIAAGKVYYVDAVNGSDATADGTKEATPYKTLAAALNAATAAGVSCSVVKAAAGDYREKEVFAGGLSNRVSISNYRSRIVGAGAGKSVIWGAPDPATGGMGPNATRCVFSAGNESCVQGFTLRDGYAAGGTDADGKNQGGGAYQNSSESNVAGLHVVDCIITNCHAGRGGAGYSGAFERCRVTGCSGVGGNVLAKVTLFSCVVEALSSVNKGFCTAYYSTFIGKSDTDYILPSNPNLYNCIVMNQAELINNKNEFADSIVYNVGKLGDGVNLTLTDPLLIPGEDGLRRPQKPKYHDRGANSALVSPALGFGAHLRPECFNLTDFDGRPLNLIDGKTTVGAFQWPELIRRKFSISIR